MQDASDAVVPQIEIERSARIVENSRRLAELGLPYLVQAIAKPSRLKKPREKKVKGAQATRTSSRVVVQKHSNLCEGNLSEVLPARLPIFKLGRFSAEKMPPRRPLPEIQWPQTYVFEVAARKQKASVWFRIFELQPEFEGQLDAAMRLAYNLGTSDVGIETVVGATLIQRIMDMAYGTLGAPSGGIDLAMERVLKGIKDSKSTTSPPPQTSFGEYPLVNPSAGKFILPFEVHAHCLCTPLAVTAVS